jgi:SPP1 gp7 family putative phage head morphogenesis protein
MTLLAQIWDEAFENSALQGALEPPIRDAAQAAYDDAAHRVGGVGLDIEWKAVDAQAVAVDRFASSVVDINETTRSVIQEILSKGLEAGESVAEMAGDIQQAAAFSPLRAMRVARTETTRTAGAGSLAAYHDAASAGIALQKQWLAERDQVTRPEHLILDGQTVGLDEQFVIPAGTTANGAVPAQWVGMSASGPGEFAVASLTVNCRCALLPVLSEGAEE